MNSELQVQAHYLAEYTAGYKTSHFTFIRPLGIMPAVANFFFFFFFFSFYFIFIALEPN